ncbi:MAG: TMEM165/GDT1 family protein [Candidatus Omnitrophica bacterium]|nr:TMEM165/GDT1 family protein [Candidatus Omnitrophota bacterium]
MAAFIASFIFVFLAEMGDKTQLLAMAFASKYSAQKVLIAVFLATLLNHFLAVIVGHFLSVIIPMEVISFIAALSFIIFGLWTIRGDKLKGEDQKISRFGPVLTVGIAFFLAEMGDKTQLATVSLAVEYQNMFSVLMGTTLAMVSADAIGITVGVLMRKHIPEKTIKWISACIFILFGFSGVYKVLSVLLSQAYLWSIMLIIGACTAYLVYRLLNQKTHLRK